MESDAFGYQIHSLNTITTCGMSQEDQRPIRIHMQKKVSPAGPYILLVGRYVADTDAKRESRRKLRAGSI